MGQGIISAAKKARERYPEWKKDRKNKGLCIHCNSKLNRYSTICDFCYLRDEITKLKKNQNRIIKLITGGKKC